MKVSFCSMYAEKQKSAMNQIEKVFVKRNRLVGTRTVQIHMLSELQKQQLKKHSVNNFIYLLYKHGH